MAMCLRANALISPGISVQTWKENGFVFYNVGMCKKRVYEKSVCQ